MKAGIERRNFNLNTTQNLFLLVQLRAKRTMVKRLCECKKVLSSKIEREPFLSAVKALIRDRAKLVMLL